MPFFDGFINTFTKNENRELCLYKGTKYAFIKTKSESYENVTVWAYVELINALSVTNEVNYIKIIKLNDIIDYEYK